MASLRNNGGYVQVVYYENKKRKTKTLKDPNTGKSFKWDPDTVEILKKKYLPKLEARLELGLPDQETKKPREYLLETYAEKYLSHKKAAWESGDLASRTYRECESIIQKQILIFPAFQYDIREITTSDVKSWISHQRKRISGKTFKNYRIVLNAVFQEAMDAEVIARNPLDSISKEYLPKVKKPEIEPFSESERDLLLQSAEGWFRNFLAVGFFTGARTGEILGIKWSNVDWEHGIINLDECVSSDEGRMKTEGSFRAVPILDGLKPYLEHQYQLTGERNSYLFLTYSKKRYNSTTSIGESQWYPLLKKLDFKPRTLYSMRHSFATQMLMRGENVYEISKILGHTSIETTINKYVKFIKNQKNEFNIQSVGYSAPANKFVNAKNV